MRNRRKSPYWQGVIGLAVANLATKLVLAFVMYDRKLFFQKNLLFDADPNFYLNRFTHDGFQNHGFVHPTVPFLIGLTVRAVAKVGALVTGAGVSTIDTRQALALLVSPLASTVQLVVLAVILKQQLRLGDRAALLLVVIGAFCFSGLLFGSMPESFGLSGCAIAGLVWLMLDRSAIPSQFRVAAWVIAALLTVGITVTNAGIVAITFFGWRILNGRPILRSVVAASALAGGAVGISGLGAVGAGRVLGAPVQFGRTTRMYGRWVQFAPLTTGARITEALANTFLPRAPEQVPDSLARPGAPYRNRFTFLTPFRPSHMLWYLPTLFLVALGTVGYRAASGAGSAQDPGAQHEHQVMLGILVGMVGFNFGVHLFFGFEAFLYSPHWLVPVLLLMAGVALRPRRWTESALGCYGVAVAGVSVMRVVDILRSLR